MYDPSGRDLWLIHNYHSVLGFTYIKNKNYDDAEKILLEAEKLAYLASSTEVNWTFAYLSTLYYLKNIIPKAKFYFKKFLILFMNNNKKTFYESIMNIKNKFTHFEKLKLGLKSWDNFNSEVIEPFNKIRIEKISEDKEKKDKMVDEIHFLKSNFRNYQSEYNRFKRFYDNNISYLKQEGLIGEEILNIIENQEKLEKEIILHKLDINISQERLNEKKKRLNHILNEKFKKLIKKDYKRL